MNSNRPIKVFLIEDESQDLLRLQMMLADAKGTPFEFKHASKLTDAEAALNSNPTDIIVLSLTLKGSPGLSTLVHIQEKFPDVPVVILTSLENQSLAFDALRMGAQDFLVKGKLDGNLLSRVIFYAIERHHVMKEMRQKNKELERLNSLKSEFVSMVSHELRTPLTIMMSSSNNILDGAYGKITDNQKKWLKKINYQGLRLESMISDLLDLSRLQSNTLELKTERMDITKLVRHVVDSLQNLAKDKDVKLTFRAGTRSLFVEGDANRLEQVLSNLITNALKFTPEKGTIDVAIQSSSEFVTVCVADTGPGIAPENQSMIFEKFRQVRSEENEKSSTKGIGLGLAICKEIVTRHHGKIWVESELRKGSRFLFSVPLARAVEKPLDRAA